MTGSNDSRARCGRCPKRSASSSYSDRPGGRRAGRGTAGPGTASAPGPRGGRRPAAGGGRRRPPRPASSRAAAAAGPAGRCAAARTRAPATIPCRRSCSENPASVVTSCSIFGSATKVPPCRPTVRVTRPRWASSLSACRSVIRLTPSQAASSCSGGSRSPGASWPAAIAPASQSSICACTVVPRPRTSRGGTRARPPGSIAASPACGLRAGRLIPPRPPPGEGRPGPG